MINLPDLNLYYVFIFLFVTSFSSFVILLGYTLYYYIYKRHVEQEYHDPRDIALHEALKIVETARAKAIGLLSSANEEAKTILHDSEEVHSGVKELFDSRMQSIGAKQMQAFDQMSHDLLESYKAVLSQEKDTSIRNISDLSTQLKTALVTDVSTFKENIQKITSSTESKIRDDLTQQYNGISQQIATLKTNLQKISNDAEQNMKGSVSSQTDLVNKEISSFASKINQLAMTTEQKITSEITKEYSIARDSIHKFTTDLSKIIQNAENDLRGGIKAEFDQVRKDLDQYKNDRYAKIDQIVRGVLEEVARDVLGKTMNAKDHEELIMKSLESIKKTTNLKEL